MRARIVDNLLETIQKALPREGHAEDPKFLELCKRIQGQVVTLIFTDGDAFELEDNNYRLPAACWAVLPKEVDLSHILKRSQVTREEKTWDVSTINRKSSSTEYPEVYAETLVWLLEPPKTLTLVWQGESVKNSTSVHDAVVERLRTTGSPEESEDLEE